MRPLERQGSRSVRVMRAERGCIDVRAENVHVSLVVKSCAVEWGRVVKLVGSTQQLGNWNTDRAQTLEWHEGDDWTGSFDFDEEQLKNGIECKLVIMDDGGDAAVWEPDPNRRLLVEGFGGEVGKDVRIKCSWNAPMEIIVEGNEMMPSNEISVPVEGGSAKNTGTQKPRKKTARKSTQADAEASDRANVTETVTKIEDAPENKDESEENAKVTDTQEQLVQRIEEEVTYSFDEHEDTSAAELAKKLLG